MQRERPGVGARGAGMISSAARCRGGDRDREPVARERGGREPRRGRPRALCRGHDGPGRRGERQSRSRIEPGTDAGGRRCVRNQRSAGPRQVDCDRPAGRIDAVHRHAGRAVGDADVGRKRPRAQHGADGLAADGRRDGHRCSRRGDLAAVERARRDRSRPQGAAVGDLRRPAGRQIAQMQHAAEAAVHRLEARHSEWHGHAVAGGVCDLEAGAGGTVQPRVWHVRAEASPRAAVALRGLRQGARELREGGAARPVDDHCDGGHESACRHAQRRAGRGVDAHVEDGRRGPRR